MTMERKVTKANGEIKPRITLTADDYDRLSQLAHAAAAKMPELAGALNAELARAQVSDDAADDFVRMGGEVEFKDDAADKTQTVTLVYPGDADISQGKVSVLTPIGTALIGLSAGDAITWRTRNGELRQLTVLAVRNPQRETQAGKGGQNGNGVTPDAGRTKGGR